MKDPINKNQIMISHVGVEDEHEQKLPRSLWERSWPAGVRGFDQSRIEGCVGRSRR
jgi:hypothetical protein